MTKIIALLLALLAPESRVTGLSITPVADRTEVVILVDGSVTSRDFMIPDGRLVVDLTGVPQPPRVDLRDVNRGGVREVRVAPYQPNVARVVLQLGSPLEYSVTREADRIRISFPNRGGAFEPWTHAMGATRPVPSDAQAAPPPAPLAREQRSTTAPAARVGTQVPVQEPRIRVMFEEEPVTNVINLFSELSRRTIIVAASIRSKTITAEIRDMPWDMALEAILEANGLSIRELDSGILMVEDAAELATRQTQLEPQETRAFTIEFASVDSIRSAVAELVQPDGRVTVNSGTSTLIVQGTRSAVARVAEIIPLLDVSTPQVGISATIAFIDRTTLEAMGVVYDLKDSRGNQLNEFNPGLADLDGDGVMEQVDDDVIMLGGNSIAALGNANNRVAAPALQLISSLVLGRHSLVAFLEALQTVSMSDIQAKPYLRTTDHRRATIQVGEQTPIRTIDAGAAGGGDQAPRATVDMKDTGIILEVTPHIVGTGQVRLELRAERSNVGAAPSDIGVLFQTQNAETEVLVNDGETIVIGGLTIIEKTKSRSGIPLLMDLPVIGKLFRNDLERENKRDLLIMVTPTIIRD
ncbi:MAG TPA: secretin N-terminal domain-containing protein [Longimicrobiales bacterium]|nr:secretin N-terminal domain-containing protein [Longimicrobiales bacterium]